MPDQSSLLTPPPVSGDPQKAERYLSIIVDLIEQEKILVAHSDLQKFDPTSLQDHYRISLEGFDVEISHSRNGETGRNSYVLLFSDINATDDDKKILAYLYLTEEQFEVFRQAAQNQIHKRSKEEQERRFKEAMQPIDVLFEKLLSEQFKSMQQAAQTVPAVPETPAPELTAQAPINPPQMDIPAVQSPTSDLQNPVAPLPEPLPQPDFETPTTEVTAPDPQPLTALPQPDQADTEAAPQQTTAPHPFQTVVVENEEDPNLQVSPAPTNETPVETVPQDVESPTPEPVVTSAEASPAVAAHSEESVQPQIPQFEITHPAPVSEISSTPTPEPPALVEAHTIAQAPTQEPSGEVTQSQPLNQIPMNNTAGALDLTHLQNPATPPAGEFTQNTLSSYTQGYQFPTPQGSAEPLPATPGVNGPANFEPGNPFVAQTTWPSSIPNTPQPAQA